MINKIKKNYKFILGITVGFIISGLVVYASTQISSTNVSYDNSTSGLSSTNLKGAIDELYEKSDIRKLGNFVSAYTYNQTSGASNYCVTGEESTCKKSTCYKTKTANSCKAGDIIKYKVNDTDIVTFHVMYDNGSTLTMQSQKNTFNSVQWMSKTDFVEAGGTETDYGTNGNNSKGPITALNALESTTSGWSNVNDQDYEMGTTPFKNNSFTGCSNYNSCTKNTYTLASRTAKARMITVQEAADLGCTISSKSCPIWMYNYLGDSTNYGGTMSDANAVDRYWLSSAFSPSSDIVWLVDYHGWVDYLYVYFTDTGARAVVEVSK